MQIPDPKGVYNNCGIKASLDSTCTCHLYDKTLSFEENTYHRYFSFNLAIQDVTTHAHMTVPLDGWLKDHTQ